MNGTEDEIFDGYEKISELLDKKIINIDINYINLHESINDYENYFEEEKEDQEFEFKEELDKDTEDNKDLEDEFNDNIIFEKKIKDDKEKIDNDEDEKYLQIEKIEIMKYNNIKKTMMKMLIKFFNKKLMLIILYNEIK